MAHSVVTWVSVIWAETCWLASYLLLQLLISTLLDPAVLYVVRNEFCIYYWSRIILPPDQVLMTADVLTHETELIRWLEIVNVNVKKVLYCAVIQYKADCALQ